MKRRIYITLFALLGAIVGFLLHAIIEIWYIGRLLADFERASFGLSWRDWVLIHNVLTPLLAIAGVIAGFVQGRYWWRKIYVEQTLRRWGIRVRP